MTFSYVTRIVLVSSAIAYAFSAAPAQTQQNKMPPEKTEKKFFIPVNQKIPESVITAYFKLSALNRVQEATTLLGPIYNIDTITKITQEMAIFSQLVRSQRMEVNLLEVKKQGDWALAILFVKHKDEEGRSHKSLSDQYMIRLREEWRVVPAALRTDPAFTSFIDSDAVAIFEFWAKNKAAYEKKYLGKK